MAAGSAQAAVVDNPVTSITVSPPNPRLTDPVRTDMAWCVPDSTTAGDTFQVALPVQLAQLPRTFSLRDPLGVVVATALIEGVPAIATFTFNDYVDTHTSVCGTAFFESRLDSSLIPGTTYTLTYVVNGTTTFEPVITVRPGPTPTGRTSARKGAFFDDPNDECRTVAEACLGWYIESQVGPFNSITVIDNAPAGTTFACDQLSVRLWTVDSAGGLGTTVSSASVGATITRTCSPSQLEVVGSNIPAGHLMRVLIRATPDAINPAGGVTFTNSASVTHVLPNSTVDEDNVSALRRSSLVGGDANGVNVPAATTTTSIVEALPPVPPTTTTSIVAALPPVPPATTVPEVVGEGPQLPATGSNSMVLVAGVGMCVAGAALLAATRRRRVV
jgi:LPXTG-motif cell wall-anchored protein